MNLYHPRQPWHVKYESISDCAYAALATSNRVAFQRVQLAIQHGSNWREAGMPIGI